jgi:hypothetical protein
MDPPAPLSPEWRPPPVLSVLTVKFLSSWIPYSTFFRIVPPPVLPELHVQYQIPWTPLLPILLLGGRHMFYLYSTAPELLDSLLNLLLHGATTCSTCSTCTVPELLDPLLPILLNGGHHLFYLYSS